MDQLAAFFDMGGYAVFVWPAYGLATIGIVGVWLLYNRSVKTRQATLDKLRPPKLDDDAETQSATEGEASAREA